MGHEACEAVLDDRLLAITISCLSVSQSYLQLWDDFSSVVCYVYSLDCWGCSDFVSS